MSTTPAVDDPTRRTFKRHYFPPDLAPFVDWDRVATQAREIGGHFTALNRRDGSVVVTIFWDANAETETL